MSYINKEKLIDIFNTKADMAMGTPKTVFFSSAKMVELLPTVDAVEVVRCKDCAHCNYDPSAEIYKCERRCIPERVSEVDYCSHGEKRCEG